MSKHGEWRVVEHIGKWIDAKDVIHECQGDDKPAGSPILNRFGVVVCAKCNDPIPFDINILMIAIPTEIPQWGQSSDGAYQKHWPEGGE